MHVHAKVLRALLADRLKNSTTLDATARAHFGALQSELAAQIAADEKTAKPAKESNGKA